MRVFVIYSYKKNSSGEFSSMYFSPTKTKVK